MEHIADQVAVLVDGKIAEEVTLAKVKEQFPTGLEEYFFNIMTGGAKDA